MVDEVGLGASDDGPLPSSGRPAHVVLQRQTLVCRVLRPSFFSHTIKIERVRVRVRERREEEGERCVCNGGC